mmetsp:Transcript_5662/g.5859  ORF Transcript_5662/g.5859 Transcript_5662/m.5859 type:complete len:101 (-) Transcript_5662:412-714(-)
MIRIVVKPHLTDEIESRIMTERGKKKEKYGEYKRVYELYNHNQWDHVYTNNRESTDRSYNQSGCLFKNDRLINNKHRSEQVSYYPSHSQITLSVSSFPSH